MPLLLRICSIIDSLNKRLAWIANIFVLLACLVSAGNAMIRYVFDTSSNAWLEVQWYMFTFIVLLGAPYTLKCNEHVRVDIVYMLIPERWRIRIDILGTLLFLLPMCILLGWLSWPFFLQSFLGDEQSANAGGLVRWPIKLAIPVGLALLALQGCSEIIKRIGALQGYVQVDARYERPTQ